MEDKSASVAAVAAAGDGERGETLTNDLQPRLGVVSGTESEGAGTGRVPQVCPAYEKSLNVVCWRRARQRRLC